MERHQDFPASCREKDFAGGRAHGRQAAFTIIELLAGFAVLMLLVTLLLAAFTNFSQVTSTANKRVEVNKQSQTIFDRMAFDIGSAVTSGGIRMGFRKNQALPGGSASKNDVLILLTDAKTRDPQGRLAKIGYAVGPYEDRSRKMTLETVLRYVQEFGWDDDTTTIDLADDGGAPLDSQSIAPGIVRFELSFVNRNGDLLAEPPAAGATAEEVRAFHQNLAAVVCTVATLDEDVLQKLSPSDRDEIADRLADAVDGQSPLAQWQAAGFQDLPRPVAQGLRFYQRYFWLK